MPFGDFAVKEIVNKTIQDIVFMQHPRNRPIAERRLPSLGLKAFFIFLQALDGYPLQSTPGSPLTSLPILAARENPAA